MISLLLSVCLHEYINPNAVESIFVKAGELCNNRRTVSVLIYTA